MSDFLGQAFRVLDLQLVASIIAVGLAFGYFALSPVALIHIPARRLTVNIAAMGATFCMVSFVFRYYVVQSPTGAGWLGAATLWTIFALSIGTGVCFRRRRIR